VIKFVRIMALMAVVTLSLVTPALAQDPVTPTTPAAAGASGIGKLASAALESMARQPEVAGNIQTAMIIAAALIEGFTFFALYICMTAV